MSTSYGGVGIGYGIGRGFLVAGFSVVMVLIGIIKREGMIVVVVLEYLCRYRSTKLLL